MLDQPHPNEHHVSKAEELFINFCLGVEQRFRGFQFPGEVHFKLLEAIRRIVVPRIALKLGEAMQIRCDALLHARSNIVLGQRGRRAVFSPEVGSRGDEGPVTHGRFP